MLRLSARLVSAAQREDWKREWESELWHRWQFLAHSGAWNRREVLLLLRRSAGMFPDALCCFASRESVRSRLRDDLRSPWMCLTVFAVALLAAGIATFGFPATRDMLRSGLGGTNTGLVFIWFHPTTGAGDEGLPPDAIAAWSSRSRMLAGIAPFVVSHPPFRFEDGRVAQPLVVRTQASLFRVLGVTPAIGQIPAANGVVVTNALWRRMPRGNSLEHAKVRIGRRWYAVSAVLPASFHFLSRQPAAYLVEPALPDAQQMVVARVKPGVSQKGLDDELTRIAEDACYYFFRSELRYSFLKDAAWIPLRIFAVAMLCSGLLMVLVSRVPLRQLGEFLRSRDKLPVLRRTAFFAGKIVLGSLLLFVASLEWSRSQSAVLFGSHDPAAGPVLLWLDILGSAGLLFLAIADQRARCRVCLRLLCFPVRVGCPGCLLLNWSGTELLCPEGHGMMHVPDLAPSWDEESERWIALDESWKDLFAETK